MTYLGEACHIERQWAISRDNWKTFDWRIHEASELFQDELKERSVERRPSEATSHIVFEDQLWPTKSH